MLVKAVRGVLPQAANISTCSIIKGYKPVVGLAAFCFVLCTAALSAQQPAEALEAVKAAAAATAEQKVQRYHTHTREAQQQLLERVLRQDQQQQQAPSHSGSSPGAAAALLSGSSNAAAGAGEAGGPSAAELTMQQLVALLAQRDVRVDDTPAPDTHRCGSWQSCATLRRTSTASPLLCLWCV